MSSKEVVNQRIDQGEAARSGAYIHLVGKKDEAIELWEAYLSIQDEKYTPKEEPAELTEEQYESYVRRIYDAVRSTDRAYDAFQTDIQGNTTKKQSGMMNFLDSIRMFELQLVAGKLVTTIHNVHGGKLSIPAWPMLNGLGLHKYQNFPDRMEAIIEMLTLWKTCCKDMFYTEVTWDKRIAMQPTEEGRKKAQNASLNLRRKIQKEEAKKLKEENKKRKAAALGADEEDNGDQNDVGNEATPAPRKSALKKQRTKPGDFITISSRPRPGKKATAEGSAEPAANAGNATHPLNSSAQASINADGPIQAASPAASVPVNAGGSTEPAASSTPASNYNGGSTQPFSDTAFNPINAGSSHMRTPSSAPASNNTESPEQRKTSTPSAIMKTAALKQTNEVFAGPAMVNHDPAMKAALAARPMGRGELYDTTKFAVPLGKPPVQYGNQRPLQPGQYSLPQQPQQAQSPGQDMPPQYDSSDNHRTARQGWSHGFHQGSPQGLDSFHAIYQRHMQGNQGNQGDRGCVGQMPCYHYLPQNNKITLAGIQFGQGNPQQVQKNGQMSGSPYGQVADNQGNSQFSGRIQHGRMSSVHGQMARIQLSGPNSYVINNYYQPHLPEDWTSQAHDFLAAPYAGDQKTGDEQDGEDDQDMDVNFDEWLHSDPDLYLPDDQTVGYRYPIKSGDDKPEDNTQDSQSASILPEHPTTSTPHQRTSWSAAPTAVGEDDAPPQYEPPRLPENEQPQVQATRGSVKQSPLRHQVPQHSRNTSIYLGQGPKIQTGSIQARFDGQEAGTQRNLQVPGRNRGQIASFQPVQMPGGTSTPTEPQVNQPSAATNATSAMNPPSWQSHLRGRNPDDIQAFMDCSAASLGIPPGRGLGERGTDPAVLPSMFKKYTDVEYGRLGEREVGIGNGEEPSDVDMNTEEYQHTEAPPRR